MKPTKGFIQKLREKPAPLEVSDIYYQNNSINSYGGPKFVTPIHSVVMGDFQLQNWRVLHQ